MFQSRARASESSWEVGHQILQPPSWCHQSRDKVYCSKKDRITQHELQDQLRVPVGPVGLWRLSRLLGQRRGLETIDSQRYKAKLGSFQLGGPVALLERGKLIGSQKVLKAFCFVVLKTPYLYRRSRDLQGIQYSGPFPSLMQVSSDKLFQFLLGIH